MGIAVRFALVALIAAGCGRLGFDAVSSDDIDGGVIPPIGNGSVELVFAATPNWNSYIERANVGPTWTQPEVACSGTARPGGHSACIHAGESRQLALEETSCAGLTAVDRLGAFGWVCDDTSGVAVFYSTGLLPGRGLGTLLTASSFRDNQVLVYKDGTLIVATEDTIWGWSNTVEMPPDNSGVGDTVVALAGDKIYVVATDQRTAGYNLAGDRIAFVVLPGATLRFAGGSKNCEHLTGEVGVGAAPDYRACILSAGAQRFLWIEGDLEHVNEASFPGDFGDTYAMNVLLQNVGFSVVRNLRAQDGIYGVWYTGHNGLLADVTVSNNRRYGMIFNDGTETVVSRFTATNTGRFSNGNSGLVVESTSVGNVFTELVIASASDYGLLVFGNNMTNQNTFSHLTVSNSSFTNIALFNSADNTVVQAVSVNSQRAVDIDGATGYLLHHVVATHSDIGVRIENSSGNTFSGALVVGANGTDCTGGCANLGATLVSGVDLSTAFVGGKATGTGYEEISDWARTGRYRGYGHQGTALTGTIRGRCDPGQQCGVWDWRVVAGRALYNNSGDGTSANDGFVAGQPCPAAVHGAQAITDGRGDTFLVNALERQFDGIGDDDGLCESGEACIYSANLGAYQGEGDITDAACLFVDGTVSGVTMFGHQTIGQ